MFNLLHAFLIAMSHMISISFFVGLIPSGGTKTFDFKPVKGRNVNVFLPGNRKNSLCVKSRCLQVRDKRREKVVCL